MKYIGITINDNKNLYNPQKEIMIHKATRMANKTLNCGKELFKIYGGEDVPLKCCNIVRVQHDRTYKKRNVQVSKDREECV